MTGVDEFVTDVLNLYRQLPETPSKTNPNDRKIATELHQRRIPMSIYRIGLSPWISEKAISISRHAAIVTHSIFGLLSPCHTRASR